MERDELETFIRLKYDMSTRDYWEYFTMLPAGTDSKWAWRCAYSIEHLNDKTPGTLNLIEMSKKFKGKHDYAASAEAGELLDDAWFESNCPVALSFYYAATGRYSSALSYAADFGKQSIMDLLIEELIEYERNNGE